MANPSFLNKLLRHNTRTYLKNKVRVQAKARSGEKAGAYTVVCAHFEPSRNAAMGT
jgi:hypothetical protein